MQWELIVVPLIVFAPIAALAASSVLRRRRMSIAAQIADEEAAAEAQRRALDLAQRSPVDAMYPHGDPGGGGPVI